MHGIKKNQKMRTIQTCYFIYLSIIQSRKVNGRCNHIASDVALYNVTSRASCETGDLIVHKDKTVSYITAPSVGECRELEQGLSILSDMSTAVLCLGNRHSTANVSNTHTPPHTCTNTKTSGHTHNFFGQPQHLVIKVYLTLTNTLFRVWCPAHICSLTSSQWQSSTE